MDFATLDLSFNNPALVPLKSKPCDGKSLQVPNKALPKSMQNQLAIVASALGAKFEPEQSVLVAGVRDGRPSRLYGPAIYVQDGEPIVRFGNDQLIRLKATRQGIQLAEPTEAAKDSRLIFTIGEAKIGQYTESVLSIIASDANGTAEITLNAPWKPAKFEVPINHTEMSGYIRQGKFDEAFKHVATLNATGESTASGLPILDIKSQLVPTQDLDADGGLIKANGAAVYTVTSYKPIKTSHGASFAFVLAPAPHLGLESEVKVWGDRELNQLAFAGVLCPFKFSFTRKPNAKGKIRLSFTFTDVAYPESDESLTLNW